TSGKNDLTIRFIDSARGYAVQPETVVVKRHGAGGGEKTISGAEIHKAGRISLEVGRHTITAWSRTHKVMAGDFEMAENNALSAVFVLDPLVEPAELRPEYVASLRREDATVIWGFIVDDESGEPVAGARISSIPGEGESSSNERGFFQIYIPLKGEGKAGTWPGSLLIEKEGYKSQERDFLELWPGGDWAYRIRLARGNGKEMID